MAGKLVQVATETVTSSTAYVDLFGIDDNSPYMLSITFANIDSTGGSIRGRVLKASDSSADTTSNYDSGWKGLRTDTTFSNQAYTNSSYFSVLCWSQGGGVPDTAQGIFNLYNFFNSSEYSFITFDSVTFGFSTTVTLGTQGGAVHTVAQSNSGIRLYPSANNFTEGTFTLYKVV